MTAAVLEIPDAEPVLHLVSCGHPSPLLLPRAGGAVQPEVDRPAPPLGLAGLVTSAVTAQTFAFAEGDVLLLCTAACRRPATGRAPSARRRSG
ncbi:SpoIIE family protein phosphatase [Streptomyces sp. NPDC048257]|uniref:SpoIIE family protein phosphatase n=1 Tax=Streptomyces sp. NPDC048257 TaxID=3365526 RepID=UPI00370F99BB